MLPTSRTARRSPPTPVPGGASLAPGISRTDLLVTLMYLAGLYLGVFWYLSDSLFIPFSLCGLVAPYFLLRNLNEVRWAALSRFLFLYAVTLIGILLSPNPSDFLAEGAKGFIQLVYSTLISFLFFLQLRQFPRELLARIFLWFSILIIFGALLEISGGLREISDTFRFWAFPRWLYVNDARDMALYGQIRPKLFTEEPSHVAKFLLLSLSVWYALTGNRLRRLWLVLLTAAGLYIIRSPIIGLILPIALLADIFLRGHITLSALVTRTRPVISLSLVLLFVVFIVFGSILLSTVLEDRLRAIVSGVDQSFEIRITGPYRIARETLKRYPLWGAGIGGKEQIEDIIVGTYLDMDVTYYSVYSFTSNFLFMFVIYYGLLGTSLFTLGVWSLLRAIRVPHLLFLLLVTIIMSQTMGAFVGVRTWSYFFIMAAVCYFSGSAGSGLPAAEGRAVQPIPARN